MSGSEDKITLEDVRRLRICAEELQVENSKHYGGGRGLQVLRTHSQRAMAVVEKLEKKLSA